MRQRWNYFTVNGEHQKRCDCLEKDLDAKTSICVTDLRDREKIMAHEEGT